MEYKSDPAMVAAAQHGDADAFNLLVQRYFGMVYTIGYVRLCQHEAAEELAQEVFLRVFLHLAKLEHPEYFPTWLTRIARNLADSWHSRKQTRSRLLPEVPLGKMESEMPDQHTPSAREIASIHEQMTLLQAAVFELPLRDREILLLHYSQGLSKSEIARLLGIHPSSTARRLDRITAALRRKCGSLVETGLSDLKPSEAGPAKACGIILVTAALSRSSRTALAAHSEISSLTGSAVTTGALSPLTTAFASKLALPAAAGAAVLLVAAGVLLSERDRGTQPGTTRQNQYQVRSAPGGSTRSPSQSGTDKHTKPAVNASTQSEPDDSRSIHLIANDMTTSAAAWNSQFMAPAFPADSTGTLLRGKVLKPNGSPAAGAAVNVLSYKYWKRPTAVTSSDDEGNFRLNLPVGSYWFYVKLGSLVSSDYKTVEVRANGTVSREPEIRLQQGGSVRGTVVDTTTGRPVAGALIITDDGDFRQSEENGSFMIGGFRRGAHAICAFKEGFFRPVVNFDTTAQPDAEVRLETKPGGTIHGTVTDEAGQPLAGASVSDHASGPIFLVGTQRVTTDNAGRYSIFGYNPDLPVWSIGADANGFTAVSQRSILFPTDRNEVEVNFRLESRSPAVAEASGTTDIRQLRRLEGKVTASNDTPVSGALVAYGSSTSNIGYTSGLSDEDGRYVLDGVESRNDLVSVQMKGFAPAFKESGTSGTTTLNFRLAPEHTLSGRIIDEKGNSVEDLSIAVIAPVSYRPVSDQFRYLQTAGKSNRNGEFSLDSLPEGKVFVDIHGGNYSDVRALPLEVDRTDHVITVTAPGQISGTVVDSVTGLPVPNFTVRLSFPHEKHSEDPKASFNAGFGSSGVKFNSPDGTFTVSKLTQKAVLRVEVNAPGYSIALIDRVLVESVRNINPGANVFRLPRAIPLSGIVMSNEPTSTPLAGARVTLLDTSSNSLYVGYILNNRASDYHPVIVKTDATGRFNFEAGPYSQSALVAEKTGYGRVIVREPNTSAPVEILLEKAATVTGTIKERPGVVVQIGDGGKTYYAECRTDSTGLYKFSDVPAGTYKIYWLHDSVYEPVNRSMLQIPGKGEFPVNKEVVLSPGGHYVFNSDGQIGTRNPARR